MGAQPRNYKSMTTVYTGIVSGYDITTTEGTRQDWNIINNAMDNLINIILSQSTLKNVSMRLYAQGLTHLDPDNDNQYLTARTSRYLLNRTPKEVMDLVDRTSEEKTLENLRRFEEADHDNHVYGMFHWNPPYYSYQALSQIKVKRRHQQRHARNQLRERRPVHRLQHAGDPQRRIRQAVPGPALRRDEQRDRLLRVRTGPRGQEPARAGGFAARLQRRAQV